MLSRYANLETESCSVVDILYRARQISYGPNLMKKCKTFPIYLDEYKKQGKVDVVVLWVISQIIREPVANLLHGEFWITTEEHDIDDVQVLFVLGEMSISSPFAQ